MKYLRTMLRYVGVLIGWRFLGRAGALALIILAVSGRAQAQTNYYTSGNNALIFANGDKLDLMTYIYYDSDDCPIATPPPWGVLGNITSTVATDLTYGDNGVAYAQDFETGDWYYWYANSGWFACSGFDTIHILTYSDDWAFSTQDGWITTGTGGGMGTWDGPDGERPSTWDPDAPGDGNWYGGGPDISSGEVLLGGDHWELVTVDSIDYQHDTITDIWYLYDGCSGGYIDVADPE